MGASTTGSLDLPEEIARIDRAQAETRRFVAEQAKLASAANERWRGRFLATVPTAAVVSGAVTTLLPIILRAWGFRP